MVSSRFPGHRSATSSTSVPTSGCDFTARLGNQLATELPRARSLLRHATCMADFGISLWNYILIKPEEITERSIISIIILKSACFQRESSKKVKS